MKEYEMVREIFNECANNQMRDVFIEEICLTERRQWTPEWKNFARMKKRRLKKRSCRTEALSIMWMPTDFCKGIRLRKSDDDYLHAMMSL